MTHVIIPSKWRDRKPKNIGGTRLDESHPLTRGLVRALVFNEGAGDARDLVAGDLASPQNANSKWEVDSVYCDANLAAFSLPSNSFLAQGAGSIVTGWAWVDAPKPTWRYLWYSNSFSHHSCRFGGDGGTVYWNLFGTSATGPNIGSIGVDNFGVKDGNTHQWAWHWTAAIGSGVMYLDAIPRDTGWGVGTTSVVEDIYSISGRDDSNARYSGGNASYYYYWNRDLSEGEVQSLHEAPYQFLRQQTRRIWVPAGDVAPSATISGTTEPNVLESEIVSGGETTIITLTNDTFVAAGTGPIGSTADTQALIDGISAAASPANGWNNEVRDNESTGSVVRDSDTQATITWTAAAAYSVDADETITVTIPAAVLVTSASPVVATPTFTATNETSYIYRQTMRAGMMPMSGGIH